MLSLKETNYGLFSPISRFIFCTLVAATIASPAALKAAKFVELKVVDAEILMLHFKDGDIVYVDDGVGPGSNSGHEHDVDNNEIVRYALPLNTSMVQQASSWTLDSSDDSAYTNGRTPNQVHRKRKLNGHSQEEWDPSIGDWTYDISHEHFIYLHLPHALQQDDEYTLTIHSGINSDTTQITFTYDVFSTRSEALHVNVVGYPAEDSVKSADLYHWLGDGGARDFSSFEGNQVYLYNIDTQTSSPVGTVAFFRENSGDIFFGLRNMLGSDVWTADFTGDHAEGNYRLAVEGVGCSDDFEIRSDIYYNPFKVGVRGFYYMRIGQDSPEMVPQPRRPMWDPRISTGEDRATIRITTMHPYHPDWAGGGDRWDQPWFFDDYLDGSKTNTNAWGGHSDALDWDRHLGHVSIIYDMLLPFIISDGQIDDDNLGISESGNGIPDIIDEARYEVDFWLRLRDGDGYGHGLSNPDGNHILYQAANTTIAAWANAANCAMLAEAFRISGDTALQNHYRDEAVIAYQYASNQSDQNLDRSQEVGHATLRGRDFKMMAAAYLYNVTGNTIYEDAMASESIVNSNQSSFMEASNHCQYWGIAAYLHTNRPINYTTLHSQMKASVIYQARQKETNKSATRPSRRSTDEEAAYFQTIQNVHRTILAHSVSTNSSDLRQFFDAMLLEADYGLGRNPLNTIEMTTASSVLENEKSFTDAYTSGRDDGTPGLHPGHTPYNNHDNWSCGRVLGCPRTLYDESYPTNFTETWPRGEGYFPTRYVFAHTEFTPQQTMRGKMALYGYLYSLGTPSNPEDDIRSLTAPEFFIPGESFTVSVSYTALTPGDLVVRLQSSSPPFTPAYVENRIPVAPGSGRHDVTISTGADIPLGVDAYQVQVFLTETDGTFDDMRVNQNTPNISAREAQSPYNGLLDINTIPYRLEAEHYDHGGQGIAFSENDSETSHDCLGRSDTVDLETTTDVGGGCHLGYTTAGEWLEYTRFFPSGSFAFDVRVASALDGRRLRLLIDGELIGELSGADESTGFQDWVTQTIGTTNISQGVHTLRLEVLDGGLNINWIQIREVDPPQPLTIRALGFCGGEQIEIHYNDVSVAEFTLNSGMHEYTVSDFPPDGNVKVHFVNDSNTDCDLNVRIESLLYCGETILTAGNATRTGCGDSNTLWCNGNFDYGLIGCANPVTAIQLDYNEWSESYNWGSTSEANQAWDQDADGDGQLNIYEWAFGSSLTDGSETSGAVQVEKMSDGDSVTNRMHYNKGSNNLEYRLQVSTNLSFWADIVPAPVEAYDSIKGTHYQEAPVNTEVPFEFYRISVR